jgi:LuxR family maltose regulon positive regulatory protein
MLALAQQALERLPQDDLTTRAFALTLLGSGHRLNGCLEAAAQALTQAIAVHQAAGDSCAAILTRCNLGGQQIIQGELLRASVTFQEVLDLAGAFGSERLPIAGIACTGLATIHREWNDLEAAARLAKEGVTLSTQWGQAEIMFHSIIEMAQVHQARQDGDAASKAIAQAQQIASELSPWFTSIATALEANLQLNQGNTDAALEWARSKLSTGDSIRFQDESILRILTYILLTLGDIGQAQELLAQLLTVTQAAGAVGSTIDLLAIESLALAAQGANDCTLATLTRVLCLAEPEGYVRTFVDKGDPMATLLRQAAALGIKPEYVGKLLAAFKGKETKATSHPLVEPISERELTVLRLIAAGLSNREIAQELYVSINTIKTHTKSIYGKLNARNRTQAVNRARELGLL